VRVSSRMLFVITTAGLLAFLGAQLVYGYLNRVTAVEPATIGDQVPQHIAEAASRSIGDRDGHPSRGCFGVIFYQSSCVACKRVAPDYSDVTQIVLNSHPIPIVWVSATSDAGREAFVREHRLGPSTALAPRRLREAGVGRVPLLYVVSPTNTLLAVSHPRREFVSALATEASVAAACAPPADADT
jgi:hypothetical protein